MKSFVYSFVIYFQQAFVVSYRLLVHYFSNVCILLGCWMSCQLSSTLWAFIPLSQSSSTVSTFLPSSAAERFWYAASFSLAFSYLTSDLAFLNISKRLSFSTSALVLLKSALTVSSIFLSSENKSDFVSVFLLKSSSSCFLFSSYIYLSLSLCAKSLAFRSWTSV